MQGPRCTKPGINISMSGKTDARNNNGKLILTSSDLAATFPVKYPRAKCPTAYMNCFLKHLNAHLFLLTNINNTISQFVMWVNTPNSSTLYISKHQMRKLNRYATLWTHRNRSYFGYISHSPDSAILDKVIETSWRTIFSRINSKIYKPRKSYIKSSKRLCRMPTWIWVHKKDCWWRIYFGKVLRLLQNHGML